MAPDVAHGNPRGLEADDRGGGFLLREGGHMPSPGGGLVECAGAAQGVEASQSDVDVRRAIPERCDIEPQAGCLGAGGGS